MAKKKKVYNGTNVRIADESYERIKAFCKNNGYKIGAFVESAAIKRMIRESVKG